MGLLPFGYLILWWSSLHENCKVQPVQSSIFLIPFLTFSKSLLKFPLLFSLVSPLTFLHLLIAQTFSSEKKLLNQHFTNQSTPIVSDRWLIVSHFWVGTTSFMSSQSFSQLITVSLQYNGIKITKQCSDVLRHITLTILIHILSEYEDLLCESPYSV